MAKSTTILKKFTLACNIKQIAIKKRVRAICLTLLLLLNMPTIIAQDNPVDIDNYSIIESEGFVYISLTISAGSSCNGLTFYRSTDSIHFEIIGQIHGVCGLSNSPTSYQYIDNNPVFNQKSYYKVSLGPYFFTDTKAIELIDTRLFGFHIRPNPASNQVQVYFENPYYDLFTVTIYNLYGACVWENHTNENFQFIDLTSFLFGTYFIRFAKNNMLLPEKGKLIVY